MDYYLGVDIGTGSVKAVAFSPGGEVVGRRSGSVETKHPAFDRSEQDPEEILAAVILCINELIDELSPSRVLMVSFSAAMHSILAVDARGRPLSPCIIWADNRAGQLAHRLRTGGPGMEFYHRTGVPVHAMTPLSKLLWWRQEEPALFRKAAKFIGIKEYVFFYLFGIYVIDSSIASATGLLNRHTLGWDPEILDYAGVDVSQLSEVVPAKKIFVTGDTENERTGDPQNDRSGDSQNDRTGEERGRVPGGIVRLPAGIPVIIGASDGASANLATGATEDHAMAITIGTSGAARIISYEPVTDEKMRTFCYHVKENSYILGGATNNGAVVMQWLKDDLLQTGESYETLLDLAATVPAGSEGLLFIPYILGERAPVWNSEARGIYFGLGIYHKKAHLLRASMEGVIYSLYSIGKVLLEKRSVRELHATGGFARSALWLQMLADTFHIRVLVFDDTDSSVTGAMIIAQEALGIEAWAGKEVSAVYEPDGAKHEIYQRQFLQFERVYADTKKEC